MLKITLFFVYLVVSLFGLYKLKAESVGLSSGYILGVIAYGIGFCLWLAILRLYPLSVAFPIAAGALICGTQVLGAFLLDESFGAAKLAGAMLIVIGIVLLTLTEAPIHRG